MLAVLLIERCLADTMCMALHLRYFKLPDRHPPGGAAVSSQNTTKEEARRAFRRPQDKPPSGGKKKDKRPRINRPPKSDSDIITHNKFKTLEMEIDDNDSSDSDYPNPFNN